MILHYSLTYLHQLSRLPTSHVIQAEAPKHGKFGPRVVQILAPPCVIFESLLAQRTARDWCRGSRESQLHGGNFTACVGHGLDRDNSKQRNGNEKNLREGTVCYGRVVVGFDESNNMRHSICCHATSDCYIIPGYFHSRWWHRINWP